MARIISKRVLEDIRFRNDIADVIGSYLTLQRAGANFKAACPFHKEKTPSFHVNTERQIFHCFGCGAGGDVFGFVMQHEGVEFTMAVKMLADRAGVALELEEGDPDAGNKAALYKLHEELAHFYQRCLVQMKSAAGARRYLESRALAPSSIEDFLIGYAPDRWDAVLQWGEKNKVSHELLESAGLILKNTRPDARNAYYDRFRNRLMFPIRDEQGRVIGFSGRALDADARTAKYVNSPETPLFRKGRMLYALDRARKPIVDSGEAILCEGQIDVIRCHENGFKTAVAAQGTAFTEDHARILNRYADSVVLVFDPDKAGQDASVRAGAVFMAAGLAVRVARLPEGQDPDTFLCDHGPEGFQERIDQAESVVGFQIAVLSEREDARSEVGVMRIAKAVLASIAKSPNSVQRAKLVQEVASTLNLPPAALQDDLSYMLTRTRRSRENEDVDDDVHAGAEHGPPREEVDLCEHLAHMGEHPELAQLVNRYLPLDMVSHELCRRVAGACLKMLETGEALHAVLEASGTVTPELMRFAAAVREAPVKIRGEDVSHADAVRDLILLMWRRRFTAKRKAIEERLRTSPSRELQMQGNQITLDLNALRHWEHGAAVIEMELASA